MFNFGNAIKHKVIFLTKDNRQAHCFLNCINENDAEKILKESYKENFLKIISCEKYDSCEDCKL